MFVISFRINILVKNNFVDVQNFDDPLTGGRHRLIHVVGNVLVVHEALVVQLGTERGRVDDAPADAHINLTLFQEVVIFTFQLKQVLPVALEPFVFFVVLRKEGH